MSAQPSFEPGESVVPFGGQGQVLRDGVEHAVAAMERIAAATDLGGWERLDEATTAALALQLSQVQESALAATALALGRLEARGWAQANGAVSTAAWWRAITRTSRDSAHGLVRLATRLALRYERTAVAWRAGEITALHAQLITAGVDSALRRHEAYARRIAVAEGVVLDVTALGGEIDELRTVLERQFLRVATQHSPEQLSRLVARARDMADPDGAARRAMAAAAGGSLTMKDVGEIVVLTADLTPEAAATLRTVLDHFRNARYARGGTDHPDQLGTDAERDLVTGGPAVVPNRVKDAHAFCDLIDHVANGGLGTAPVTERPHLEIVATLADLASGVGTAILERTGTPVPIDSAVRVACDADVRLVLVDGQYRDPQTGELVDPAVAGLLIAGAGVLDYGRTRRLVPERLRRALALRDRGCTFPGCDRAAHHTQAHHVQHWRQGGSTDLDNCVLLCSRHHHAVHEGGWTIVRRAGRAAHEPGCWEFLPPMAGRRR